MTRISGDDFTLIELHKAAAERDDGLIPEMLDALRRGGEARAERFDRGVDVMQDPAGRDDPSTRDNVIAFPIARRGVVRR